ncbi:MAG TPA: aminotransferase class I/II-fold pyridoxal phosphate-dependent enzyme, partial [Armatimonadota bacterium]
GLLAVIDLMEQEPERREQLEAHRRYVSSALAEMGFDMLGSTTQIIPVRFWTVEKARQAMAYLLDQGLFAPAYYYPAVRKDEAMVRINLMATHTREQIDRLLAALYTVGKELGVLERLGEPALTEPLAQEENALRQQAV